MLCVVLGYLLSLDIAWFVKNPVICFNDMAIFAIKRYNCQKTVYSWNLGFIVCPRRLTS